MALRAPWYACLRAQTDRFGKAAALAPCIQKYDTEDFVAALVARPQRSLCWAPEDHWSFPVPRTAAEQRNLRQLLSPFSMARSDIRKLFQPSHQRFYAVTVELFCDVAGLPRPGPGDDPTVRFVLRRTLVTVSTQVDRKTLRDFAKLAARKLVGHETFAAAEPRDEMATDLAAAYRAWAHDAELLRAFEQEHAQEIAALGIRAEVQGWFVREDGQGGWHPVPGEPGDPVPDGEEQTYGMWRIPRPRRDCVPDPGRSLWFGTVPTYSGDTDAAGRPKLDDKTTYHLRCVATRRRPDPCPPIVTVSEPTAPFRLAAFFDPAGTANRRVHVRLPDFEAVQAQLATGRPVGGVEFERPAASQLTSFPLGVIPAVPGSGKADGDAAENCFFAIELITIVAMFVLSLFLPIVIIVFQLWWMLLLKFCWPPSDTMDAVLLKLNGTRTLDDLDDDETATFSTAFGVQADKKLVEALVKAKPELVKQVPPADLTLAKQMSRDLGAALQPGGPPAPPTAPPPLPDVHDPLCPVPAAVGRLATAPPPLPPRATPASRTEAR